MSKKQTGLSNRWKIIIVMLLIVAALALAAYFIEGFDQAVNNTVIQPAWATIQSIITMVITHPLWLQYGPLFGVGIGVFLTLAVSFYFWPKLKPKAKEVAAPLQDKIATSATKIPLIKQAVPLQATPAPAPATSTPSEPAAEELAE